MPTDHRPQVPTTRSFDIASTDDQNRVRELAEQLLDDGVDGGITDPSSGDLGIDGALASMLARSRAAVRRSGWSGHVAIAIAMWGERRRLLPRSADNPLGEDAMRVKLDQLQWLFDGTDIAWTLLAVDDGDPDDSATIARQQADLHPCADRVEVLRLHDAIPAGGGPLAALDHVDNSRKGGAMVLGAQRALELGADVVAITDADNSVNLGQVGLLLDPYLHRGAGAVVGDRKHPDSVLVKAEARWGPGIVVLRHMQRMVGRSLFDRGLRDTQAAFKLYGRAALDAILANPSTFGFSFDSDWLYATIAAGEHIDRVPFVFIDSFEDSASIAQGPMTTWESLLTGLVAAARARDADHDEEMAAVIDELVTAENLELVVERVPEQLQGVADADLGKRSIMAPGELAAWIRSVVDEGARR